jgi:hypothetical protein
LGEGFLAPARPRCFPTVVDGNDIAARLEKAIERAMKVKKEAVELVEEATKTINAESVEQKVIEPISDKRYRRG